MVGWVCSLLHAVHVTHVWDVSCNTSLSRGAHGGLLLQELLGVQPKLFEAGAKDYVSISDANLTSAVLAAGVAGRAAQVV